MKSISGTRKFSRIFHEQSSLYSHIYGFATEIMDIRCI